LGVSLRRRFSPWWHSKVTTTQTQASNRRVELGVLQICLSNALRDTMRAQLICLKYAQGRAHVLECAALRWVHAQYCWIVILFHQKIFEQERHCWIVISLQIFEQERLYRAGASSSPVGIAPCLNAYWTLIVCPPLVGVVASYAAVRRYCMYP